MNLIQTIFDGHAINAGFVSKGQFWYVVQCDLVLSFTLQRSRWSDAYYINLGIQLGTKKMHKKWSPHLYTRFLERKVTSLSTALDMTVAMPDAKRGRIIEKCVNTIKPMLLSFDDGDHVRALYSKGKLSDWAISNSKVKSIFGRVI